MCDTYKLLVTAVLLYLQKSTLEISFHEIDIFELILYLILQEARRKPNGLISRYLKKNQKISYSWLSTANFQIIIENKWIFF